MFGLDVGDVLMRKEKKPESFIVSIVQRYLQSDFMEEKVIHYFFYYNVHTSVIGKQNKRVYVWLFKVAHHATHIKISNQKLVQRSLLAALKIKVVQQMDLVCLCVLHCMHIYVDF